VWKKGRLLFGKLAVHAVTRKLEGAGVKLIEVILKHKQHVCFHWILSNKPVTI